MKMTRKGLVLLICGIVLAAAAVQGVVVISRGFSARDNPSWIETVMARTARRMAVRAKAKQMSNPVPNSSENMTEAAAHWADHCATCHADNGSGDTVIGKIFIQKRQTCSFQPLKTSDGELESRVI